MQYHVPALLNESIDGLNIQPDGTYLDLTFGGGGHSREILKHLSKKGRLIAFDQDEDAFKNSIDDKRFLLVRSNFRFFRNFLKYHKVKSVQGILADLGVSSHHFDSPERGFSTRFNGPLDMRMNRSGKLTAEEVVNTYEKQKLFELLSVYGELPNANKLAGMVCSAREKQPITSSEQLAEVVGRAFPSHVINKMLAKVFQAIRIEVNHEMEALKQMLWQTEKALETDGRLVVISYHSLEDRLVKNFIKTGNFLGDREVDFFGNTKSTFEQINRKVIVPTDEETKSNPRSRSAKLRIGRKL
ncbi:MAG TPA: 16S rRNA (cytosine(1402)-N(4))-methyltransferase RsmH [Tenuifilaceae bacterium]|nr:16S rRNA (cytosine(1402)-N(4))-methyltransferase RsmH [Tenuifilaceae bacterium]HPE17607.1 16S rRNA (cytosine(1402)-N(4))-methyltransferase RsmH [Tenuifilaceae bacterium]HPJ44990.1 16S rRNA (cytosine(1402)-N(4))-methyltransferase RsmH [Tenuifilaceae bacterium]HPQ33763.1 16S rRNA (cytosine(1402)-N(4))-methyltransferase RsmH [Tenuifilaceae bacterium]HRX67654.1 16S rRNA (cytosine(1402)-N(4))-methyltransferase RsmH [Tenuifilaceae bacterium]